jgi:hypothetical protein
MARSPAGRGAERGQPGFLLWKRRVHGEQDPVSPRLRRRAFSEAEDQPLFLHHERPRLVGGLGAPHPVFSQADGQTGQAHPVRSAAKSMVSPQKRPILSSWASALTRGAPGVPARGPQAGEYAQTFPPRGAAAGGQRNPAWGSPPFFHFSGIHPSWLEQRVGSWLALARRLRQGRRQPFRLAGPVEAACCPAAPRPCAWQGKQPFSGPSAGAPRRPARRAREKRRLLEAAALAAGRIAPGHLPWNLAAGRPNGGCATRMTGCRCPGQPGRSATPGG